MSLHLPSRPVMRPGRRTSLDSREAAYRLLKAHGRTVLEVIRIDTADYPESILYLGISRCPMTAWVWSVEGVDVIRAEPGFAAVPRDVPPAHDGGDRL